MTDPKINRYMLDSVNAQERHARAAIADLRGSSIYRGGPRDWLSADDYTCPELRPDRHRPGASDHLAYPSLIAGRRVMPRAFEAHRHVITPHLLPQLRP